jgi:hypothetical protein
MAYESTWKAAAQTGTDKPKKELLEVYDERCGKYEGDESGKTSSLRPAKNTKQPFGSLKGK